MTYVRNSSLKQPVVYTKKSAGALVAKSKIKSEKRNTWWEKNREKSICSLAFHYEFDISPWARMRPTMRLLSHWPWELNWSNTFKVGNPLPIHWQVKPGNTKFTTSVITVDLLSFWCSLLHHQLMNVSNWQARCLTHRKPVHYLCC